MAVLQTSNDKIMVLSENRGLEQDEWGLIKELESAAWEGRLRRAMDLLGKLVPEYVASARTVRSTPAAATERVVEFGGKKRFDA